MKKISMLLAFVISAFMLTSVTVADSTSLVMTGDVDEILSISEVLVATSNLSFTSDELGDAMTDRPIAKYRINANNRDGFQITIHSGNGSVGTGHQGYLVMDDIVNNPGSAGVDESEAGASILYAVDWAFDTADLQGHAEDNDFDGGALTSDQVLTYSDVDQATINADFLLDMDVSTAESNQAFFGTYTDQIDVTVAVAP